MDEYEHVVSHFFNRSFFALTGFCGGEKQLTESAGLNFRLEKGTDVEHRVPSTA